MSSTSRAAIRLHVLPAFAIGAVTLAILALPPAAVAPASHATSSFLVTCANDPVKDTPALQSAISAAERGTGSVSIAAGTCALNDHLPVNSAVTISGAGPSATFLVQHAYKNIFQITGSGVTVKDINLDTATYNASAPVLKDPNPGVLFTNANNTTVLNVTGEAGSGYGMRFVGPDPCYADQRSGNVITNVTMTTTGTGGFAAVDVSCQNGASLSNITIHGGMIAIYRDQNVTLSGERFTPGPQAKLCAPPWVVTGPANAITIGLVTSAGGHGVIKQTVTHLVATNQTITNLLCL